MPVKFPAQVPVRKSPAKYGAFAHSCILRTSCRLPHCTVTLYAVRKQWLNRVVFGAVRSQLRGPSPPHTVKILRAGPQKATQFNFSLRHVLSSNRIIPQSYVMSHKSTRLCQVGQPGIPSKVPSLPINKNSNLMRQINTHPQPSLTSQYHFHVVFVSVLRTIGLCREPFMSQSYKPLPADAHHRCNGANLYE